MQKWCKLKMSENHPTCNFEHRSFLTVLVRFATGPIFLHSHFTVKCKLIWALCVLTCGILLTWSQGCLYGCWQGVWELEPCYNSCRHLRMDLLLAHISLTLTIQAYSLTVKCVLHLIKYYNGIKNFKCFSKTDGSSASSIIWATTLCVNMSHSELYLHSFIEM